MATSTIYLPAASAVLPDGSASNLAPALQRVQGSEAAPKKHIMVLAFDGTGNKEIAWWTFRLPADYVSGGVLKIPWWLNAITNAVKWQAQVGAITPADADTPIEHAMAAAATVTTNVNTVEANRLTESSITLTMDSAAPGDLIILMLFRDSADAADTAAVDAVTPGVSFEYTS